jgi:hypothetical protein
MNFRKSLAWWRKTGKISSGLGIHFMVKHDIIASEVMARDGQVFLKLRDGSTHSFPVGFYPRLARATPDQLASVRLRVGGRALRWEDLDEDIWIADAVLGLYPAPCAAA